MSLMSIAACVFCSILFTRIFHVYEFDLCRSAPEIIGIRPPIIVNVPRVCVLINHINAVHVAHVHCNVINFSLIGSVVNQIAWSQARFRGSQRVIPGWPWSGYNTFCFSQS